MEDEQVFGKGAWVYCNAHMKAHQTGWCSVSVRDKLGLGIVTTDLAKLSADAHYAAEKCRAFGLPLYADRKDK